MKGSKRVKVKSKIQIKSKLTSRESREKMQDRAQHKLKNNRLFNLKKL
jgi:hypothetical protein